jgi:nucleoid DNA-binding protein
MAVKTSKPKTKPAPEASVEQTKAEALRIKALIDRIAATSQVKRKEMREVVEATLAELGAALAKGESLNLPGLGIVRVTRKAENGVMVLRLRPNATTSKEKPEKAAQGGTEALAEAGEAG